MRPALRQILLGGAKLPRGPVVAIFGDSRTSRAWDVAAPVNTLDTRGYLTWARLLSNQIFDSEVSTLDYGVSGAASSDTLTTINAVTAPTWDIGVVWTGTNDALTDATISQTISNIDKCCERILSLGKVCILFGEIPQTLTAAQQNNLRNIWLWAKSKKNAARGIYMMDVWDDLASSPGALDPVSAMMADTRHLTIQGNYWVGLRLAQLLATILPVRSVFNTSTNLNSAFDMAGTSGTLSSGITGQLATSYTANLTTTISGSEVVASKVVKNGKTWQQFVISGTWSPQQTLTINGPLLATSGFSLGVSRISMAMEIEVDAGATGTRSVQLIPTYQGGVAISPDGSQTNSTDPFPAQAISGVLRAPIFTLPADANRVQPSVKVIGIAAAAQSLTFRFGNLQIFKF